MLHSCVYVNTEVFLLTETASADFLFAFLTIVKLSQIKGICFIRTSRPNTSILYANDEQFAAGRAKIVKSSASDKVFIIGAGVTLHEALEAANELQSKYNVNARVMDPFTIKPLDEQAVIKHAEECGGKIVTVEDHYAEGGLGEAVMSAVAEVPNVVVRKLAVRDIPRSGPPNVLLDMFGISAKCIVKNVVNMM
jgi:transketolase